MADEWARFVQNNTDSRQTHPEDDHVSSTSSLDEKPSGGGGNDDMASAAVAPQPAYNIPSYTHEANTGPKGVIADARAFAKWRKSPSTNAGPEFEKPPSDESVPEQIPSPPSDLDRDDEDFLRRWRESRMRELQSESPGPVRSRRSSPSIRRFGRVEPVDAEGYLNAVDHSGTHTVVVVFIYDESSYSRTVEAQLESISRRHIATRFIKLHYAEAEIDSIAAPGVLAYCLARKSFEPFANLVPLKQMLSEQEQGVEAALEGLLRRHSIVE